MFSAFRLKINNKKAGKERHKIIKFTSSQADK